MFNVDYVALGKGLELMAIGMIGIFAVLFMLYLTSLVLIKFLPPKEEKDSSGN